MANRYNTTMAFGNFSLMVRRGLADLNIDVGEDHRERISRCHGDGLSISATIGAIQDAERQARRDPFGAGQSSMAPVETFAAVDARFAGASA